MTEFVLIHGTTQSPAGWDLLVVELERRGHTCVYVDLPTEETEVSALGYAHEVDRQLDLARAEVEPPVVVAHSGSGLILPVLAAVRPVAHLVYLAAFVPEPGRGLLDQLLYDDVVADDWKGVDPTSDPDAARKFLFHDCDEETREWAMGTLRLFTPHRAYEERFRLDEHPDVPATYVVCAGDRTIRPEWSRRVARERLGVEPVELPGGHCPHVSCPAAVADVLESLG